MKQSETKQFILASSSPRRRQILIDAGYDFDVICPTLDEPEYNASDTDCLMPEGFVQAVAHFKAMQIAEKFPDAIVVGADTIVVCKNDIIGKPKDADDAREILSLLSHNRHCVITGVSIVRLSRNERILRYDKTFITMKPMSKEEIEGYIASGEWQGKAGAYALQQGGDKFVLKLEGSYSNVIGLPVELTSNMLEKFGIFPIGQDAIVSNRINSTDN